MYVTYEKRDPITVGVKITKEEIPPVEIRLHVVKAAEQKPKKRWIRMMLYDRKSGGYYLNPEYVASCDSAEGSSLK